ncbi:putative 2-dehydropantoate 2-reductase [cf. Phormidesmis sp. LEGE 11477]|uniref:putative 2-dehydropantoate 2-reductase n=1 Tax=cf. Phormidesmis sp. LEGE 11477 TaxID=1828680 RepID=UPI0018804B8D|nr:putative 2-dehydropantoate 2-reductase [cf. Phormidesmis sp. LEGE 11477]MBE9060230.1 putative 2-dehydropantoate 2-reductase [cf. Phormidesmis sp. LEGE 11477]
MSLRYAIIGTGAIGGYYGARLQQAGCDVHFLLRSSYASVKAHGLRVESIDGDFELPDVNAYHSSADMPAVDVAIVALKTTQNENLHTLLPALNEGGVILSLQNGFGVEAAITQQLDRHRIPVPALFGGLCFICSNQIAPGHFRHLDYGKILLGVHNQQNQRDAPTPLLEKIAADFAKANVQIETTDDLPMARWQKLVWNVPYNGLSVVLNATTAAMMADTGVRSLITTLMQEVVTAADAWGEMISPGIQRTLPGDIIDRMLTHTETMAPYRTSMKIDYDEKRPLEIAAILGNPVRVARSIGIETPSMAMLQQQLRFLDERNRKT